jgi:hypothetical protein
MCEAGRAESVVDIHHAYTPCAGIEHRQQRSDSPEARTIASAGWHGNDRALD